MSLCVDKICRTCMTESKTLVDIWSTNNKSCRKREEEPSCTSIIKMLELFTTIDASKGDGLPEKVCVACINELNRAFAFNRKCEQSDYTLRAYLDQMRRSKTANNLPQIKKTIDEVDNAFENLDAEREPYVPGDHTSFHSKEEIIDEPNSGDDEDCDTYEHSHFLDENDSDTKDEIHVEEKFNTKKISPPLDSSNLNYSKNRTKISFQCYICRKEMSMKRYLQRHFLRSHVSLECSSCQVKFKANKEYLLHMRTQHPVVKAHKCDICSKSFGRAYELKNHLRWHTEEKPHVCTMCGKGFKDTQYMKHHMMLHNKSRSFDCTDCDKSFLAETELYAHLRKHTGDNTTTFQCKLCPRTYGKLTQMKGHMKWDHGDIPRAKPQKRPYLCSICGQGFVAKSGLKLHLMRHNNMRPFKCTESGCKKSFVTTRERNDHLRTHTGDRPYVCDICGNGFTMPSALKTHRRTHTGEKPYACEFCPMRFSQRGTLNNHRRTHTGERPYKCTYPSCERTFAQRVHCVTHMRTHREERP